VRFHAHRAARGGGCARADAEDVNGALGRCERAEAGTCPREKAEEAEGLGTAASGQEGPTIILVEGILVLENDDLRSLADLKVFCDCDPDLVAERRLERDRASFAWKYGGEPGRQLYYEKFTVPGFYRFILPRKAEADIVVPNNPADGPLAENAAVSRLVEEVWAQAARARDSGTDR
jgi:uridine kinase